MLVAGLAVLAASSADAAQLTLSWADSAGGTARFKIERKTGTVGTYTQIATTGTGATTYADSAIATGTTYCYRVRASNASGDSGYSNEACGSTAGLLSLTVARTGVGSGTILSAPAGINCGLDCTESFAAGTVVSLTAVPASGSSFSGWSGGGCTGTSPCVVTGNSAMTVSAGFGLDTGPALDKTPPTVNITSPTSGAPVSGAVSITVSARDNTAVTRVELWIDGALVSTDPSFPWSFTWNSASKPNGAHSLQARAYDAAGNVGTSASISVSVSNGQPGSAPAVSLAFAGTRDRVGQGSDARTPDGIVDGAFTLALGSGSRTLTRLELYRMNNSGTWDTVSSSAPWTLGLASSLDGPLLNTPGDSVSLTLSAGSPLVLFAADTAAVFGYAAFAPGVSFTVTATFADGSTASATTTVPQ
jgi:hypothetical protein